VVRLEQYHLIQQARFAPAKGVHPAPHRRYALTDVEVESLDEGRADRPATRRQDP